MALATRKKKASKKAKPARKKTSKKAARSAKKAPKKKRGRKRAKAAKAPASPAEAPAKAPRKAGKASRRAAGNSAGAAKKAPRRSPKKPAAVEAVVAEESSASGASEKSAGEDGEPPGSRVEVGEKAPSFRLSDQRGEIVSSDELSGKPYVLYFYPRDDTPGCTREACGFRDDLGDFERAGVRVVGVSPDTPESHAKFRDKYGLKFTLLSDREKALAREYGVWGKKKLYGRESMGIQRSTFLIDEQGMVRKVWRNVKVDGHVRSVLDSLRELS